MWKPDLVPKSCDNCKPVDLWPTNAESWEIFTEFSGIISQAATGRFQVDYQAARYISRKTYVLDTLAFLEDLEAIAEGFNSVKV